MALNRSASLLSKSLLLLSGKTLRRRKSNSPSSGQYSVLEPRQLLAAIVWSSGDITADSSVSTNGTPVFAISGSAGSGSVTVNGVEFLHSTRSAAAGIAQGQSLGSESLTTTLGNDNSSSFETGGLGNVGEIIRGGWFNVATGTTATVNLTGLVIGDVYEVQLFANDARVGRDQDYIASLGNGVGGIGIDLELNNSPTGDRAGDFGIGTFTADGTTQSFEMSGWLDGDVSPGRIQINAIQLRKLGTADLLPGSHPLINEFSASNAGAIDDDNGNSSDWIEIYNAGEDPIDLAGYSLTDDPTDTSKYVFPSTTLLGGQYLVVFAGDDVDLTVGSDLYTGFGLSAAGEYLGFFDVSGNLVTEFGANGSNYPAQFSDVGYGLVADGNFDTPSFFATPTPGFANSDPVDGVIDELPTVSVERGFYEQAFEVEVASQTPGASVVYTTDGSEPSFSNGTRVDPADSNSTVQFTLDVSETTSLRTAIVRGGFVTRAATTHTYVFVADVITSDVLDTAITSQYSDQFLKDALLDIPTISFNYDTEITDSFVPEQAASIEWLAPDGSEGFQVDAGISAFGGFHSSSQRFTKKNFRVEFRKEYGASQLEFPLFEGFDNGITPTESFDSLDFRTGSHDRFQLASGQAARFVDDTLLEAGHVAPHGRFVHIYTNGVYWGQYHLRERWDADFLAQYYGGEEDDYEATNGNHTQTDATLLNGGIPTPNNWSPGETYDGDGVAWDNITALADTAGDGNPEGPTGGYQELKEVVNLEQYLDFTLIYMAGGVEHEFRAGGSIDGSVGYTFYLNDPDRWLRTTSDRTGNAGAGNILGTLLEEGDPEFMSLYADRIQHLFGEGGVLSAERSTERLQARLDETAMSYVLESARYERFDEAKTPDQFSADLNIVLEDMLPQIQIDMINRLRARGHFPGFDAPSFSIDGVNQNGGPIEPGDLLTLDATDTIYYTVDGTDPRLVGGGLNPNAMLFDAGVTSTQIFAEGSLWKYFDQYTTLDNEDWTSSSYNDSQWAEDASELGYGDNDLATTIGYLGPDNNKSITTYFRRTFDVAAGNYSSASLDVHFDDGVAVYLNGVEIGRENLAAGAMFNTTASGTADTNFTFNFDPSLLNVGSNTLAVEIHQASGTSSDISFNASLSVTDDAGSPSQPVALNTSTNVQARTFHAGEWSGLSNAVFTLLASQSDLRITEIYYNPSAPSAAEIAAGFVDNDEFEFIELYNPSTTGTINLNGVQFADGITFAFGSAELGPGEHAVIVKDTIAFAQRYGTNVTVLGQYTGSLSNSGETVALLDSTGVEITSVTYNDGGLWAVAADGAGASLVLDSGTTSNALLGKYYSWRASVEYGGTPGTASVSPSGVVVNEILSHTDLPFVDSIELFNPTGSDINIGGWFLSDSGSTPFKYQIPSSTVLSAGGYVVFDESDFDFALSSLGDQVYLTRDAGGLPAFEDVVEFSATFNGDAVGRLPNGSGRLAHIDLPTLGTANLEHGLADVIISEVHYNPLPPTGNPVGVGDNDIEFVEVYNRSSQAIDLSQWRLRGDVDFDFPAITLEPGESIPVLAFDPLDGLSQDKLSAFRTHYGISASVPLLGGFTGDLGNSFGRVSLQQADTPPASDPTVTPWVTVDELVYDDLAPFANADNTGESLNRIIATSFGNAATSWTASTPTPGSVSIDSAGVQGRHVFYNGSSFDGNDSSAGASDDLAISGKSALLPGQTATFGHYTSYAKGINGLFVDIANLGSTNLVASDFEFSTGNSSAASGYQPLGIDPAITVRAGAGVNGSDRVSLIFPDGSVTKTWLQVTVKASAATGLSSDDVFYFGSVIGETGASSANALVNLSDVTLTRVKQSGFGSVGIDSHYDFNRDGRVNLADIALARTNQSGFSAVSLITAPGAGSNSKTFSASSVFALASVDSSSTSLSSGDSVGPLSFVLPGDEEVDDVGIASIAETAPIAEVAATVERTETTATDVVFSLPSFFELSDFETQEDEDLAFDDVLQQRWAMYDHLWN